MMEGIEPQEGMADFPIAGSNEVGKVRHAEVVSASPRTKGIAGQARILQYLIFSITSIR